MDLIHNILLMIPDYRPQALWSNVKTLCVCTLLKLVGPRQASKINMTPIALKHTVVLLNYDLKCYC